MTVYQFSMTILSKRTFFANDCTVSWYDQDQMARLRWWCESWQIDLSSQKLSQTFQTDKFKIGN